MDPRIIYSSAIEVWIALSELLIDATKKRTGHPESASPSEWIVMKIAWKGTFSGYTKNFSWGNPRLSDSLDEYQDTLCWWPYVLARGWLHLKVLAIRGPEALQKYRNSTSKESMSIVNTQIDEADLRIVQWKDNEYGFYDSCRLCHSGSGKSASGAAPCVFRLAGDIKMPVCGRIPTTITLLGEETGRDILEWSCGQELP